MKTSRTVKSIVISSVLLLVAATVVFAHGGWGQRGYGHMRGDGVGSMMGSNFGGGMMDDPGCGRRVRGNGDCRGDLTDGQMAKLEETRDNFRKGTQVLRGEIEEKSVALRNEMDKDDPDTVRAKKLQEEISTLRGEFDQQKLQHRLEVQKIAPESFQGRGYGRKSGRGGGYGCR